MLVRILHCINLVAHRFEELSHLLRSSAARRNIYALLDGWAFADSLDPLVQTRPLANIYLQKQRSRPQPGITRNVSDGVLLARQPVVALQPRFEHIEQSFGFIDISVYAVSRVGPRHSSEMFR